MKHPEAYKCERCRIARRDHVHGECPDGLGNFRQRRHSRRPFAAQSFPAAEVNVLYTVLSHVQRGGKAAELGIVARHPAFASVTAKIQRMKARVEEQSREAVLERLAQVKSEG